MKCKSCAFTGHRPKKFPWGCNEADARCAALKEAGYITGSGFIADGGALLPALLDNVYV